MYKDSNLNLKDIMVNSRIRILSVLQKPEFCQRKRTRPGVHRAPWVFGRKLSARAAPGIEQIFSGRRLDLAPISVCPISVRCLGHNAPVWKRRSEIIWPHNIPRYRNRPAAHLSVYK